MMKLVNYTSSETPKDYVCDVCHVRGVKLWREYSVFGRPDIHCADCAEERGRRGHAEDPTWQSPFRKGEGDQISWMVPAVPTEDNSTYWGYTSVPDDGVTWWQNLPTRAI